MRQFAAKLFIPVCILVAALIGKYAVLGGAQPVTLKVSSFYGAVATTLRSAHGDIYQPIEGKDYTISNTVYFDNKSWLVIYLSPVGNFSDPGVLVLQKDGNMYETVLGPSSASFSSSQLSGLPPDLANYLGGQSQ